MLSANSKPTYTVQSLSLRRLLSDLLTQKFRLILIPYARQFVSATTAQMSIPPLVIPLSVGDNPPKNRGAVVRSKKTAKSHAKAQ